MRRMILILGVVLLIQLGLAVGMYLTANEMGTDTGGGPLLKLLAADVDQLRIDGPGDQGSVVLKKVDGKWNLPDHFNAPADQAKVDNLIATLIAIERSWPVAKTADAEKRFKVADDDFERRLVFQSNGKDLATLLLGSSPGFRKIHARLAGEPQVFDIAFSTYQASLKAVDWVDKKPLRIKADEVTAIDLPGCRLIRENGRMQLADLGADEQTNAEQARELFDRLTDPTIMDVYAKAGQQLPGPVELSIKIELQDGKSKQYDFAKGDEASYALLQVTDAPYLYKVSPSLLKDLQETARAKLVQAKPAVTPAAAEPKPASNDNPQD